MANSSDRYVTIRTGTIIKVVAIILAIALMWFLRDILTLLLVALFIAALVHPAARWGEKRRIPKGLMVMVIYLVTFAFLTVALALIVPNLVRQTAKLSQTIGSQLTALSVYVQNIREFSQLHGFSGNLSSSLTYVASQFADAASGLFSALTGVFGGIAGLVIVLVMAFYMVVEDKEAIRMFRNFVPEKHQEFIASLLTQVETKIGAWLRGEFMLMFTVGIMYYIGLLVIGVDGPLPLALFGGFTEFIPYLGPILSGIPIIIVAFTHSPVHALLAFALMIVVQQIENHILVPKVMQRAVGLNPLVSIVAILVGARLFGFVGVLLAIPFATMISVVLTELYRRRQSLE
jgi:predicted PurR-regulated permease PerM